MVDDLERKLTAEGGSCFGSAGERRIAQFLDSYGFRYVYEHGVLVTDAGKPRI